MTRSHWSAKKSSGKTDLSYTRLLNKAGFVCKDNSHYTKINSTLYKVTLFIGQESTFAIYYTQCIWGSSPTVLSIQVTAMMRKGVSDIIMP